MYFILLYIHIFNYLPWKCPTLY